MHVAARRGQRGQALFETALVLPLLVLVTVVGTFWAVLQLDNGTAHFAAQEGAQAATAAFATTATGVGVANHSLSTGNLGGLPVTTLFATCTTGPGGASCPSPGSVCLSTDAACAAPALSEPTSGSGAIGICAFTTTPASEPVVTVIVEGWVASLVPLPFVGNYVPISGYSSLPRQGVEGT